MRPVSIGANPTANTLTTLYTVPKGYYAKIVSLIATNQSASNKHVTFDWVDSSASAFIHLCINTQSRQNR